MRTDDCPGPKLILLAATVALVCGCGGGSADGGATVTSTTSTSTSTTTSTTTTTTLSPTGSTAPSLSGVAATGAPLLGATVKVVDATGTPVGSGTTSTTDGAYRFTLTTSVPKMPLLIQVAGIDATGAPVSFYSLARSATAPMIANVTPASNAVVAQILGTDPKTVFAKADSNASSIALLGEAAIVTNASDLVKTIIKTNLTDFKITTLDLFQDASFAANKSGLDGVLEGLRIQISKDGSGKDVLLFSNKFNLPGVAEVTLDLASARAELTKTSGGSVAKAITSTNKATTSLTTVVANLGVIDDLSIALNKLIAQGSPAATFLAAAAVSSTYAAHNGRTRAAIGNKLADYAANNYQLSKLQVTGCADNPFVAKACVKVAISALVTDAAGKKVEVFDDVITYSKTTTPNWVLVGNGYTADFEVFPVAFATYGLNGAPAASSTARASSGVQIVLTPPAGDIASRTVQIPSGYSIPMAYCNLDYLCVKNSTTDEPVATGELKDTLPVKLSLGAIGNLVSIVGAKYLAAVAGSTVLVPAYLAADVPADLINAPYPMLDGITSKPLLASDVASVAGLSLSWANWASANPNLKIFMARTLISSATSYVYSDALLPEAPVTSIKVPSLSIPPAFSAVSYQVWLGAQDSLGRRYYSKFTNAP